MDQDQPDPGPDAVRAQLHRILASDNFDASKRNRQFLSYAIDETLEGRADRIKAYTIATSVFGRDASFDPQLDSIVRIEAGRLRRSLERYYLTANGHDPVRITIPTGSYVPVFQTIQPDAQPVGGAAPTSANRADPAAHGRTIFVMPFEEEGDQSAFPDFTRGFARQVIVGLTRFSDLFVFGAETTFSLTGGMESMPGAAALGAHFLLRGATVLSADHCRVDVLLIDARSGQILWAESYEMNLHAREIIRVRDEVANCVARTLAQPYGIIFNKTARDADAKPPCNLISYDWVIRFYQYARSYDGALFGAVRDGLEQTIIDDPHYAEAFACLSLVFSNALRFGHDVGGMRVDTLKRALSLARRAIALAPNSSRGHHALSLALWFAGDVRAALAALETSYALNPNDTDVMADLGLRYAFLADWARAVPLIEESFARNPAQSSTYRKGLFLYHYANEQYDEALVEARRIETPNVLSGFVPVAIASAQLGLLKEAADAVKAILAIDPRYGDHLVADLKARNLRPDLVRLVVDGMRKAGLSVEAIAAPHGGVATLRAS
jgi:TolB-like protein